MKKILSKTFAAVAAALAIASLQAMPAGAAWVSAHPCGGHQGCATVLTTSNLPAAPAYVCPYGESCPYGGACQGLHHRGYHRAGRHSRNHCHR